MLLRLLLLLGLLLLLLLLLLLAGRALGRLLRLAGRSGQQLSPGPAAGCCSSRPRSAVAGRHRRRCCCRVQPGGRGLPGRGRLLLLALLRLLRLLRGAACGGRAAQRRQLLQSVLLLAGLCAAVAATIVSRWRHARALGSAAAAVAAVGVGAVAAPAAAAAATPSAIAVTPGLALASPPVPGIAIVLHQGRGSISRWAGGPGTLAATRRRPQAGFRSARGIAGRLGQQRAGQRRHMRRWTGQARPTTEHPGARRLTLPVRGLSGRGPLPPGSLGPPRCSIAGSQQLGLAASLLRESLAAGELLEGCRLDVDVCRAPERLQLRVQVGAS